MPNHNQSQTSVTFVIPHKGREAMLLATLSSIAAQKCAIASYDIVLVSQNETVSDEVKAAVGQVPLTVLHPEVEQTISASRNQGAALTASEYLAFLDADIELATDWLETCLTILRERPNTVLTSAMQVAGEQPTALEHIRVALSNAELDTDVAFLPGRNLLVSRHKFLAAGQFPEHLMTCEDYYFTDKVNQLGKLYYTSSTQYVHLGEDKALSAMFEKEIWRGQSNLASLQGRKIPLREWPSFIVPLAIPALFVGAIVLWLLNLPLIAMLCLMSGILPIVAYSLRLYRLVRPHASLFSVLAFYITYFPARAIGTLGGVLKTIGTSSHAK